MLLFTIRAYANEISPIVARTKSASKTFEPTVHDAVARMVTQGSPVVSENNNNNNNSKKKAKKTSSIILSLLELRVLTTSFYTTSIFVDKSLFSIN